MPDLRGPHICVTPGSDMSLFYHAATSLLFGTRRHLPFCTFTAFLHRNLGFFVTIVNWFCWLIAKLLHEITLGKCNLVLFCFFKPLTPIGGKYVAHLKHR